MGRSIAGSSPLPAHEAAQAVARRIDDEAASWVDSELARALLFVPIVAAIAVASTALYRPLYRLLADEDRIFEWLQVGSGAIATVFGGMVAVSLWRRGQRLPAGVWAAFALGCFFVTGEEISWGQRIFGVETPDRLAEINDQGETTVHNIKSIPLQTIFNGLFAALGLYGSVVAFWLRGRFGTRSSNMNLFVPPVALFTLFFLGFLYRALRLLLFPEPRYLVVQYGEYTELCMMIGLAAFAFLVWRRVRPRGLAWVGAGR